MLLFANFCCIYWKGERQRSFGWCCLSRDNGLLRSPSAAITALLISWLVLCPSAHLHFNRADLKIIMVSCHLLDLRQNCTRVAVECNCYSSLIKNSVESRYDDETHFKYYCFLFSISVIKKERQPPSPDDVIVLSDNEPSSPLMNGHCFTKTDTDKLMVRKQLFKFACSSLIMSNGLAS